MSVEFEVDLPDDEYAQLEARASAYEVTVSEYLALLIRLDADAHGVAALAAVDDLDLVRRISAMGGAA